MIYNKDQRRKYQVGDVHIEIEYSNTTDEYYRKLGVLQAVMDNYENKINHFPISQDELEEYDRDKGKVKEMYTLLQISTNNFDGGSRGKKHKRLMNKLYRKYK